MNCNFNSTSTTVIFCEKIIAFNDSWTVAQFALISLDGVTLYKSEHLAKGLSDYIDLLSLSIPYETEFRLKAIVDGGADCISDEILLHRRAYGNIAYFLTGSLFKTKLTYSNVASEQQSLCCKACTEFQPCTDIGGAKDKLLNNYKDLIATYENSRHLYEKVIKPYDNNLLTDEVLKCSQLVGYNNSSIIINWIVELLDGKQVYESRNFTEWKTMILDLSALGMNIGTQFKVKVLLERGDVFTSDVLEYFPLSNTIYYEILSVSNDYELKYRGIIPSPLTPPILKCSSISLHTTATVWTSFELLSATSRVEIYSSSKYHRGNTWSKNLNDLALIPNTKLILYAAVAGKDCEPYVILEYDPTVTTTATFTLVGNAFITAMLFEGTL